MTTKKKSNKPDMKTRLKKFKKFSGKKLSETGSSIKSGLNINKHNKRLFIFETILFVGVIAEFIESIVLKLDIGTYPKIILLMFTIGIVITFALGFIEKIAKGTIIWLVRLNSNKILRTIVHIIILSVLFFLFGLVYLDTMISLNVDIGLNATTK